MLKFEYVLPYVGNGAICSTKKNCVLLFFVDPLSGGHRTGCSNGCVHSIGCFVDRVLADKVVRKPISGNFVTELIAAQRDLGSWF